MYLNRLFKANHMVLLLWLANLKKYKKKANPAPERARKAIIVLGLY